MIPAVESLTVEFKISFNEDVVETLVAFSNAKGGTVYIGVADKGEVKGIQTHSIDDISFDKVQLSIDTMRRNQLSITEDPLSFLLKNNLIKENKITNAAYLLFKKNDSIITTIELGRFQNDIVIKDSVRTKSDVLTQIDQVLDFVKIWV